LRLCQRNIAIAINIAVQAAIDRYYDPEIGSGAHNPALVLPPQPAWSDLRGGSSKQKR
jgi:hypothetical protein